ncbi:MAG: helix-turn-helix domain-containing protein [Lachnospiraceae bacterium]
MEDKRKMAKKLFDSGKKKTEIAKELGVTPQTIRRWQKEGWGSKKKTGKRSRAQYGNKNAAGAKGNPNPKIPDNTKHGGYSAVYMDALREEERELIGKVPKDAEELLTQEIQLFSIRERRILQALNRLGDSGGIEAIARLEQELSSVQHKKTNAIVALANLGAGESGNGLVDEWIAAVMHGITKEKKNEEGRG